MSATHDILWETNLELLRELASREDGGVSASLEEALRERTERKRIRPLTDAELRTAKRFVCAGLTYEQLAADLGISENTARSHMKSVFSKLGINRKERVYAELVLSGYCSIFEVFGLKEASSIGQP